MKLGPRIAVSAAIALGLGSCTIAGGASLFGTPIQRALETFWAFGLFFTAVSFGFALYFLSKAPERFSLRRIQPAPLHRGDRERRARRDVRERRLARRGSRDARDGARVLLARVID